jgi:centromeric protein E
MPLIQEAIRVMIRIKPTSCPSIYQDTLQPNVLHCGEKCYTLDHIFTAESTDQEVFERVGLGMVDNALKGYNNTLFVYGQTGTGKTYTMSGSNKEEGLIQKCVNLIRTKLENESQYENYTIKMSYLEIYN